MKKLSFFISFHDYHTYPGPGCLQFYTTGCLFLIQCLKPKLRNKKGEEDTGDKVTVDGKIIIANGPESSALFGKAIIESINL